MNQVNLLIDEHSFTEAAGNINIQADALTPLALYWKLFQRNLSFTDEFTRKSKEQSLIVDRMAQVVMLPYSYDFEPGQLTQVPATLEIFRRKWERHLNAQALGESFDSILCLNDYSACLRMLSFCKMYTLPGCLSEDNAPVREDVDDLDGWRTIWNGDHALTVHASTEFSNEFRAVTERVDTVIPFSGGLDSLYTACRLYAEEDFEDVLLLHVNYGSPYSKKEMAIASELMREMHDETGAQVLIVDFSDVFQIDPKKLVDGYLMAGRNGFIATLAYTLVQPDRIFLTSHYRDASGQNKGAADKNHQFFGELTALLGSHSEDLGGQFPVVTSLTSMMTKAETIADMYNVCVIDLEASDIFFHLAQFTTSCYDSEHDNCGVCYSCFKKWRAIKDAEALGMPEGTFTPEFVISPEQGPNFYSFKEKEDNKGRS